MQNRTLPGYKLYVGTQSKVYSTTVDVGLATTFQLIGPLQDTPYYFALSAYNIARSESGLTPEVTFQVPPKIVLQKQTSGTIQVTLSGDSGFTYTIQTSSNLVNWVPWTNRIATNGTISVVDFITTNQARRFYRAVLDKSLP